MAKLSPYRNFANANITFLAAGEPTTNSVGNISTPMVPVIDIRAYVKLVDGRAERHKPDCLPFPIPGQEIVFEKGVSDIASAYECIAVNPMILPPFIQPLQRAIATISGLQGYLFLEAGQLNPPYGQEGTGRYIESVRGTLFYGWFVRWG